MDNTPPSDPALAGHLTGVLRATRRRRGHSQRHVAAELGISLNSLALYERGARQPDVEFLAKFAAMFDLDLQKLVRLRLAASTDPRTRAAALPLDTLPDEAGHEREAGYDAERLTPMRAAWGNLVPLPFYVVPVAATESGWSPHAPRYMALDPAWAGGAFGADVRDLALLQLRCDAMEPFSRAGDILLADTSIDRFGGDGVYVIHINGSITVRRLQRGVDGSLTIGSDNAAYADLALAPERLGELRVLGRVRWIGRAT